MSSQLPRFRTSLLPSGTLSNHHRSTMRNVALQVFPLRADMARMRQFINSYLNFVDDEHPPPYYFKPAMPYVMLQILYYPYLAVTTSNTVWLTQREVSFSVPLECYLIDEYEDRVFNHYATCTPFLYLDVQPTITSGRDIFGLPKVALRLEPLTPFFRPDEPELLTDLRLRSAGPEGDKYNPFLKVYQDPPRFTSTRIVRDAVSAIPSAALTWLSIMTGIWERTVQLPLRGYERTRDVASILQMGRAGVDLLVRALPAFSSYRPALVDYESTADIRLAPMNIDMISLKQFRDAEETDYACYQSLVSSSLYTDRINAAGSLGDPLSPELSGGAFVRIYETPTQPVMDSFGLVAESRMETKEGSVWTIRPELPFWLNADLSYSLGTNLSWRTKTRSWSSTEVSGDKTRHKTRYDTFGGGALQEVPQRLISPDTAMCILALPLGPEGLTKIRRLCHEYFCNELFNIEPWPLPVIAKETSKATKQATKLEDPVGYVYMIVYDVLNSGEGVGLAEEHDVELVVPFSWSWKVRPAGANTDLIGYGVFPIYGFSDSEEATITQTEVFGRPTVLADISGIILDARAARYPRRERAMSGMDQQDLTDDPANSVDEATGTPYPLLHANYEQSILKLKTSTLGALFSGDQPKDRTLMELVQGPPERAHHAGKSLLNAASKKGSYIVPWVGLKQVVDCRLPTRASYQSIVMQGMNLQSLKPPQLIKSSFKVRIARYQSIPIVDTLDLKVEKREPGDETTIDTVKAAFAIWLRVDMQAQQALNVASRAGNSRWCYATEEEIQQRSFYNQGFFTWLRDILLEAALIPRGLM
jgi:hypothetical protein